MILIDQIKLRLVTLTKNLNENSKDFIIVMQHPVLYENIDAGSQIEKTLIALENFQFKKLLFTRI